MLNPTLVGERKFPIELERHDGGRLAGSIKAAIDDPGLSAVVLASTGARCTSRSGDSVILDMREEAVDLSTFIGAPLLRDHYVAVDAIIGSVRHAWLLGGCLYAQVQFSSTARDILTLVAEGHLPRASIGFEIQEAERHEGDHVIATRWRPYELSLVAIPADRHAQVLSREKQHEVLTTMADDVAAARVRAFHRAHRQLRGPEWEAWAANAAPDVAHDLGLEDVDSVRAVLTRRVDEHLKTQLAGLIKTAVGADGGVNA